MTLGHPYSILITDDDPAARETLREIFAPQGYNTLMAESGEEAIDLVRDHEVHLALMDMH
jgi:CheY-like chemotaxis protein